MANLSIEQLWSDFSARLGAFIRSRVEDEAAAQDLLQEVFLRIHTRMATLRDSERIESWVYQIARHAIIDHYRARRSLGPIPETVHDPEELFQEPDSADEIAASLRDMVAALPEPYREALVLTEFQGLSQQELANRLGISLSGAKSRVQRARQKIKDELLTCCHFEFDRYGRIVDYWEHCCCCCPDCG
jgi:RNA polymerase sigma-70 factor (ECF subfamily)